MQDLFTARDRSPVRALVFIPLLIVISSIPAFIGWFAGSGLGALLDQVGGPDLDWIDAFKNRFRDGIIWARGLGSLGGQLPDFFFRTALLLVCLWLLKTLYKRPVRTWLTSAARFRRDHFIIGFLLTLFAVSLILAAYGYASQGNEYRPKFLIGPAWQIGLAGLGLLVVVCLNAFGEEVLFRGWAMQQTAAFFRHPAVYIVLPSIGFALLHREFEPWRLTQLLAMGLSFGWVTWRLGGLELAAGAHGAFNIANPAFLPKNFVLHPEPETLAQISGMTLEQAARMKFQLPPSLMDWLVLIPIALVPVIIAEAMIWWQNSRRGLQDVRTSTPSS